MRVTVISSRDSIRVSALADSGADQTIVSLSVVKRYEDQIRTDLVRQIFAANDSEITCVGSLEVDLEFQGVKTRVLALVAKNLHESLLICKFDLIRMKILPASFPSVLNHVSSVTTNSLDQLFSEYEDIFADATDGVYSELKPMDGPPMKIHLRKDVTIKPTRCLHVRRIPLGFEETANREIESLLAAGVIRRVEKPTAWISPAAFLVKPDGKSLRLVVDLRGLNRYVLRPVHPFPTVNEITSSIPAGSSFFMKLDALKGYYQIRLDEESQLLTTFITPQGRFCWTRATMGLCASGDEYCARGDAALRGIPGVEKLVDDILIYGSSEEEFVERVKSVFERCRSHQITLARKKVKIGSSVPFAGFIVSEKGVSADPEKLRALEEFPIPDSQTAVRSFLGLANQLSDFCPDLAHVTGPLRGLLRKGVAFVWLAEHQTAFDEAKRILLTPARKAHFDQTRHTALLSDASRLNGLGFCLLQSDSDKATHLIQCGSRSLTSAERNYATIEIEMLAIVYGVLKCRYYLAGTTFEIVTDHSPLKPILGYEDSPGKALDQVENPRLQRLLGKISGFAFTCTWVPGKRHMIADALSRAPVFEPNPDFGFENYVRICAVETRAQSDPLLDDMKVAALADSDYRKCCQAIREVPNFDDIPTSHPARALRSFWGRLSVTHDLIVIDSTRLFVPMSERRNILDLMHRSHCGMVKMYQLSKSLYWWPGIKEQIKTFVDRCRECQTLRGSRELEKHVNTTATRPWEAISSDLFHYGGKTFVITVDRFSGFPFVSQLRRLNSQAVIKVFWDLFLEYGFPSRCRADGGPQYRTEMKEWLDKHNVLLETSSAHHPQSNGHAESGVKNCKYLLTKYEGNFEQFRTALLEWRNCPRSDGRSPAQLFLGRRQRTALPVLPEALAVKPEAEPPRKCPKNANSKEHSGFLVGERVLMQDAKSKKWTQCVTIKESRPGGRSYFVEDESGTVKLRNRRFLRRSAICSDANT